MSRLNKLLLLSSKDRRLLVRVFLLVTMIRLGLWLLPFRVLRRLLARVTDRPPVYHEADPDEVDKIAWAVKGTSRYIPVATCLTQALAVQILLSRRGIAARLHIGVAKNLKNRLIAHAWVESQGRIVVGGARSKQYVPLLIVEEAV